MPTLVEIANKAVADYPDSDVECAMAFCKESDLTDFIGTSNDRLVKLGRRIKAAVDSEAGLELLVQESQILINKDIDLKVPKLPFGNTGLQMPIVTLGCMRFQQEWGGRITNMNQVDSDCQDNLLAILKTALIDYGITHIETARGYGCSELQLGAALKQLIMTDQIKRQDFILQTKVNPNKDVNAFRKDLETSFKNLQVDYVDLFAFHGMNMPEQLSYVFGQGNEDNQNKDDYSPDCCMSVIKEYQKAGKIKHIGFSTHASTDHILRCVNTDAFEYVNLHHHYFGSYTASGGGPDGHGNLACIKLLNQKNMGVFVISPYDKGGRLYAPSKQLYSLTLPEMEPIIFKSQWLWNHYNIYNTDTHIHTFTVGAGRPSDLDQPAVAAYLHKTKPEETMQKLKTVVKRLDDHKKQVLGEEWTKTWWQGLTKAADNTHSIEHNQLVWLYNSIHAFGLLDFAKNRYSAFEGNFKKWDESKALDDNIDSVGRIGWGYVPGIPAKAGVDYSKDDLAKVPSENLARVVEAEDFVRKWCASKEEKTEVVEVQVFNQSFSISTRLLPQTVLDQLISHNIVTKSEEKDDSKDDDKCPPEWETAFDMRPWPDYPEQPSRAK